MQRGWRDRPLAHAPLASTGVTMQETGKRNPALGIESTGLKDLAAIHFNLTEAELCEEAIRRGEARLTAHGELVALTAPHTGRSPKDKYIVRDSDTSGKVWW